MADSQAHQAAPQWTDPLRVVFLADFHIGSHAVDVACLNTIIAKASSLMPDLVLLGGDYVNMPLCGGGRVPPRKIARILSDIKAPLMLEPLRRDSGPAIAAGAAFAAKRESDPLVVALAADHVITDPADFAKVCRLAAESAAADRIVTFGVRPTRPATEYGYIRAGAFET